MIVDVILPGYYDVSADIKSKDKNSFGSARTSSTYLNKGKNTVSLYFLGSDIGISDLDGPYLIGNALVYPEFKARASILAKIVGETGTYHCKQFFGCNTDMVVEIKRIANNLCEFQDNKLLLLLNRIDDYSKKHPDVARNQLSRLFNKAKALEKSGSCYSDIEPISDRQEQQH